MSDNKPFGDCNIPGCHMGAMRGMMTCGMHKSESDPDTRSNLRKTIEAYVKAQVAANFKSGIESWLQAVRHAGYVVRVEQVPCEPLAMGNHRDVVTVYPVRK